MAGGTSLRSLTAVSFATNVEESLDTKNPLNYIKRGNMSEEARHICAMLTDPVSNYVIPGLTSYMLTKGKVRVFHSERDHHEQITPHSHRFALASLVLKGVVFNHIYKESSEGMEFAKRAFTAKLGGLGFYSKRPAEEDTIGVYYSTCKEYHEGQWYHMAAEEIHRIEFSKDAIVLLFEGENTREGSEVLLPVVDGEVIDTFKTENWMFKK